MTLEGRWGTTDEFATIPFHLVLFSAALVELAKSIPVHSLILSSHLFFCLPLFLFPFTVPCRIVFAKSEDLETWPIIIKLTWRDGGGGGGGGAGLLYTGLGFLNYASQGSIHSGKRPNVH